MSSDPQRPTHRRRAHRRAERGRIAAALTALTALIAVGAMCATLTAPTASAAVSAILVADDATSSTGGGPIREPETTTVAVAPEADGAAVSLDVAVYAPDDDQRHPAVVLAHGFGGSRQDLDGPARELAARGYVALAYSARGFGRSGGLIHLMDPAVDGVDVSRLVDSLALRSDVLLDSAGDPRVGMSGGSYGGAASLIGGGTDARIDALVAGITWNDLATAFFPSSVAGNEPTVADLAIPDAPAAGAQPNTAQVGVYKRRWASQFFASAVGAASLSSGSAATADTPLPGGRPTAPPGSADRRLQPATGTSPVCGRFEPTLCRLFLATSTTGKPSPELIALLHRLSPARTNARVKAPTLLVQGMNDSLFGLDQADANAREIAAAGARVAVRWFEGGHDGGETPAGDTTYLPWFDTYLRGDAPAAQLRTKPLPVPAFAYSVPSLRRGAPAREVSAPAYPGLAGAARARVTPLPMADPDRRAVLISPPGGDPAATTAIPGVPSEVSGALASAAYGLAALPGQSAAFDTTPLAEPVTVVGEPTVRLSVTSTTTDATFFVTFWKVAAGPPTPARRQVAPVRVATRPGVPTTVEVALPAGTFAMDRGTTWRVLVSASDAAYATPTDARSYLVSLASPELTVTAVPAASEPPPEPDREVNGLLAALAALLIALIALALFLRRRRVKGDAARARTDLADVPLSVSHLVKTYADGHRAVDDVSWEARRGQVVGLLGPNGAGKTTTIRMIVGLIRQDSGEVHVHGRPVHFGSPALAGIGALIEGPGFLPHLSGRANLEAYWDATGRPRSEARFEEALDVAALGNAVERPVKAYSHGMRQRLGIAQAMLGMPEVLLLDEPTNGLDPPQIAAMRPVLRGYAETGRTVVVSSHLLTEVEMTCSHVVVMHRGRVVLKGSVEDLVESADTTVLEIRGDEADAQALAAALRGGSSDEPATRDPATRDEPGARDEPDARDACEATDPAARDEPDAKHPDTRDACEATDPAARDEPDAKHPDTRDASDATDEPHVRAVQDVPVRPAGMVPAGPALSGLREVLVEPGEEVQRVVVHASSDRSDVVAAAVASGARVVGVSGRRHLEEVFLGVIAADDLDSARQVRPR